MNTAGIVSKESTPRNPSEEAFMQFIVERSLLLKALGHVQSVVERRGTIAVISHIKLDAKADSLALTGTDMDIALMEKVVANVSTPGATTVPAHTFYDIVRKLPEGSQVEITVRGGDSGRVNIRAGASKFSLSCLPVEDFPVMAEGDLPYNFTLSSTECQAIVEKPSFAISTEETRYYLNGIYLHAAGEGADKTLRAVATDGHRLARVEVSLPAGAAGMPGVIVPRKTIYELRKLLEEGKKDVHVALSDTKIRFVCGDAVLVSKLIDGNFPDYERVIPSGNDKIMEVECKRFTQAVDRVSIISSEKSRAIKFQLESGKLTLSASSAEHGTATEELEVTYSATPIEIGFNSRYMLDMMAQMEGETVQFNFADAAAPALVRDQDDVSSLYVIMPMRV